jgi:hypothetical protein
MNGMLVIMFGCLSVFACAPRVSFAPSCPADQKVLELNDGGYRDIGCSHDGRNIIGTRFRLDRADRLFSIGTIDVAGRVNDLMLFHPETGDMVRPDPSPSPMPAKPE